MIFSTLHTLEVNDNGSHAFHIKMNHIATEKCYYLTIGRLSPFYNKAFITDLKENHFKLDNENSEWIKFCKFTYEAQEEADKPLLSKLEKLMPHWTPKGFQTR